MKRTFKAASLSIAGIVALGTLVACSPAEPEPTGNPGGDGLTCAPVSVAFPTSTEAKLVTYAVSEGKIADPAVQLEFSFLEVPALIQATGSDQYDLLQTSLTGFAGAVAGGAPLVAVAPVASRGPGQDKIVVAADSPYQSLNDLKDKTVAVGAIGSTVTTLVRMGIAEATGLDAKVQGGEIKFVEMAPATAITGLTRGTIDAAFIYQQPWWAIQDDSAFRELADTSQTFIDAYGFLPVISMMITTQNLADAKADCLIAARDLLAESWAYAQANADEVANALTESESVAVDDLKHLITDGYKYGGTLDPELLDAAQKTLQTAFDSGELNVEVPDLADYYLKG